MKNYVPLSEEGGHDQEKVVFPSGIGVLVGGLSGVVFACSGAFAHLLNAHIGANAISFVRVALMVLFGLAIAAVRQEKFWTCNLKESIAVGLSGTILSLSFICQYMSFQMIDLSEAMTLISCSSIFILLINVVAFKTKPSWADLLNIAITTTGCFMCTQPQFNGTFQGQFLAISTALLISIVYILVQNFCDNIPLSTIIIWQNSIGLVLFTVLTVISGEKIIPETEDNIMYLFGAGICATIANILVLMALKIDTALMTSIGRTSDIATSVIFNFTILGEPFSWMSASGSLLVMAGIILSSLLQIYHKSRPSLDDLQEL